MILRMRISIRAACQKRAPARLREMLRLLCLSVCVLLVGQALAHTYFSPLDFLQHDRASVQLGMGNQA